MNVEHVKNEGYVRNEGHEENVDWNKDEYITPLGKERNEGYVKNEGRRGWL